jgi:RNA polymerase sigma factor (sigma-70 family)
MAVKSAASPILDLIRRGVEDRRLRELPDPELLRRFHVQRDQAAFHALLRRHGGMVLEVCRSMLGNEADAEDAFQATFLILAHKAASIRKTASLGSWLYGVGYRTALKARAQAAARRKYEARAPARRSCDPDDLSWREVRQVIHAEVSGLPERYRAPLVLCDLEGATQEAAARQLNLSKSTLRERLECGRTLLRARLLRRGLGPAALLGAVAWPAARLPASVPVVLLSSTVQAARLVAAGQAAQNMVSAQVAALTKGVMQAMFLTKLKSTVPFLLAALVVGAGLLVRQSVLMPQPGAAQARAESRAENEPATDKETGETAAPEPEKIDRRIGKEPVYQSKSPRYCLLVFGPQARGRVWLVQDGDTLYVDRNGNGDLTEEGKRIQAPPFAASDHYLFARERSIEVGDLSVGGLTHTGLVIRQAEYRRKAIPTDLDIPGPPLEELQEHLDKVWKQVPDGIASRVYINLDVRCYGLFEDTKDRHVRHMAWIDGNGVLAFAHRPQDAPVVRFGGPLTLQVRPGCRIQRGEQPGEGFTGTEPSFWLGTRGHGPGTFVIANHDLVPGDAQPSAEIRFPAKARGGEPVVRKISLKSSPANAFFYSAVEVPEEAGLGVAKVMLTFEAWKEAHVIPSTAELPVTDPTAK